MKCSRRDLSEIILLIFLASACQAAKIYRKEPGRVTKLIDPNIKGRFTHVTEAVSRTRTAFQSSTSSSETVLDAARDKRSIVKSQYTVQSDRNVNQNTRQSKAPPKNIKYTLSDVKVKFPWISRPTGVGGAKSSRRKRSMLDGLTRFNNPTYLREHLEGLHLDKYNFQAKHGMIAANGKYKVKLSQHWRGLPVYGFNVVLEQENDTSLILESTDGEFLSAIEEDIHSEVPAISKEDAIQKAIEHNKDQQRKAKNASAELVIHHIGRKAILVYLVNYLVTGEDHSFPDTLPNAGSASGPSMPTNSVPFQDSTNENEATNPLGIMNRDEIMESNTEEESETAAAKRPWVVMDANNGTVYQEWNGLALLLNLTKIPALVGLQRSPENYTIVVQKGPEPNRCYYKKPIGYRSSLMVRDKPVKIRDFRGPTSFKCTRSNKANYDVTNGVQSPRNSAYKWASEGINLIRSITNMDINFNLTVEVHYRGIVSAWTGIAIWLGDGDNTTFYPMVGPDVIVHEVAHAATEWWSRLGYWGHNAAIEDSYSDMAACAFMSQHNNGSSSDAVYQIGASVTKTGLPIRDMCNPRNPNLLLYDPERPIITHFSHWDYFTVPHNGSALYNKVFCELSKKPHPWSIRWTFKVFTTANYIYWGSFETFETAVCGVRKAARDLFNTYQAMSDVDDAFATVGLACPYPY